MKDSFALVTPIDQEYTIDLRSSTYNSLGQTQTREILGGVNKVKYLKSAEKLAIIGAHHVHVYTFQKTPFSYAISYYFNWRIIKDMDMHNGTAWMVA